MTNDKPSCLPLVPGIGTIAVHAGQEPDHTTGAVIPALSLSTTFKQKAPGEPIGPYDYSRSGNPTREAFEAAVAGLEGAKHALAFSSGSATTATIINMFKAGDHIISVNDVYGGTNRYINRVAAPIGFESTFVDMTNLDNLRKAFKPNTKVRSGAVFPCGLILLAPRSLCGSRRRPTRHCASSTFAVSPTLSRSTPA